MIVYNVIMKTIKLTEKQHKFLLDLMQSHTGTVDMSQADFKTALTILKKLES